MGLNLVIKKPDNKHPSACGQAQQSEPFEAVTTPDITNRVEPKLGITAVANTDPVPIITPIKIRSIRLIIASEI